MRRFTFLFSLILLAALTACSGNQPQQVTTDDKGDSTGQARPAVQPSTGSAPTNPGGAPPAHGGAASVEKPAELVELEKAFEKSPSDEATKKKLVTATYEYGKKLNYDPALPPKVKYPEALRMFRRTLELDPAHKEALAEKDQIEGIYKQMGRPIPQ